MARLRAGTLSADLGPTIAEAVDKFIAGLDAGSLRPLSGKPYKPSTLRGYKSALRERIVPTFGSVRIGRLVRADVQNWSDRLAAEGLAPSTVKNVIVALRVLITWATPYGWVHVNPCQGLRLGTGAEARDRVASPAEAALLIDALPPVDKAGLGLAVYAGLRIGELLALDVAAIDLENLKVHVRRGWDPTAREFITTKNRQERKVPIVDRLADLLTDHFILLDHPGDEGLLFPGQDPKFPIHPQALRRHALTAWEAVKLEPLGFHEARHTFASIGIAAGLNAKTLSTHMGHANIAITLDRYGHLLPGNEDESRALLDTYLDGDED